MKRIGFKIFLVVCICMSSVAIKAQYYYYNENYFERDVNFEFGGSVGFMNCLTDLGGKKGIGKGFIKDLNMKNNNFSFSIFTTATFRYVLGLRLEATFGKIEAYDSILKTVAPSTFGRYERNLSFRSPITDIQLSVEFHPLYLQVNYDKEPTRISPYLLGGIGFFTFNPQAKLSNQWYDLKPLRLEGQGFEEYPKRKDYKLSQLNIPLGFGVKYEINQALNARFEFVHRSLQTDYLDDVSTQYIEPSLFTSYLTPTQAAIARRLHDRQGERIPGHTTQPGEIRGDPKDNDSYFSFQAKISVMIGRLKRAKY
jgi:hypothetical protein